MKKEQSNTECLSALGEKVSLAVGSSTFGVAPDPSETPSRVMIRQHRNMDKRDE